MNLNFNGTEAHLKVLVIAKARVAATARIPGLLHDSKGPVQRRALSVDQPNRCVIGFETHPIRADQLSVLNKDA